MRKPETLTEGGNGATFCAVARAMVENRKDGQAASGTRDLGLPL